MGSLQTFVGTKIEYKSFHEKNGWRGDAEIMANDGESYTVKGRQRSRYDDETLLKVTPKQVRLPSDE